MNQNIPAGWYDDGNGGERYWDGVQWTENVRAAGAPSPDRPVGDVAPPPSSEVTQVAPGMGTPPVPPVPPAPESPSYPPQQQSFPGFPAAGGPAGGYPQPGFPGSPPQGGSKKPLIFGIVGAVLVLAIVGVVLALTLGGGDDNNDDQAGNDPTSESTGDPTEAAPTEAAPTELAPTTVDPLTPSIPPEAFAYDYLTKQADGDFAGVCEMQSTSFQQTNLASLSVTSCSEIDDAIRSNPVFESLDDLYANSTSTVVIETVETNGEVKVVSYDQTIDYTGDDQALRDVYEGQTFSGTVDLVVEDGEWKVNNSTGDFQ